MGRLFDTNADKSTTTSSTKPKGRLFAEPVPEKPSTLGKVAGFLAPTTTKTVGKLKKGEDVTAKDVIGSALEVGSYLIPGGAIAKGVGLGIKGAGMASKVATGAATGALSGGMFNAGGAIADGKSASDVIKSTLTGVGIGGIAGGAIGTIAVGLAARKLSQKTEQQFLDEATKRANFGPIPEASRPRLSLPAPPKSPLHEEASKFNVRDDFVNSQIKKETQVETMLPKQGQALRATRKNLIDFIKNETDFLITTQQKIPKNYSEKLTKIWNSANKPPKITLPPKTRSTELAQIWNESKGVSTTLKSTNIPKSEVTPTEFVVQAKAKKEGVPYVKPVEQPVITVKEPDIVTVPDVPVVPSAPVAPVTPVQEGFQSISYAERTAKLNQMDSQHIEDVVFNGIAPEGGLPKEAYISHLYNQAETNPALAERLATSGVVTEAESKAGQNLGALAQARGSVVNIIRDAHETLKKALPGYVTKGEKKALETIQSDIKTAFSKFNDKALSVEERLSAIDILKCK